MVIHQEVPLIERSIAEQVLENAGWFPIVSVTGPRQSGKSTLIREVFRDYEYVNLEDERVYNIVRAAPMDFILEHPHRLIIDEAQRVPGLFDAIQVAADESGEPGRYILSGSQNFLLAKNITQTLAGRVGVLKLMPLSYKEALTVEELTPDEFMLRGGYPRLYDANIPARVFYRNYVSTYVERDAAGFLGPRSLVPFQTFLGLCAQSTGNLVNASRLANDVGVARATIDSWLSILETSYVVFRLHPYHANLRKRLTKTPKLYFYDTGLLCHVLGIHTLEQLRDSEFRGAVFENLIIEETLKRHMNAGDEPRMFFYRDDSKMEVDLVDLTDPHAAELIEIKASQTYQPAFVRHLESVGCDLGVSEERRYLVMRSPKSATISGMKVWSAHDWLTR